MPAVRPLQRLQPSTQIFLTVNGFSVSCKVKDIRTQAGFDAVDEINQQLVCK
jgi:hypothetical protein